MPSFPMIPYPIYLKIASIASRFVAKVRWNTSSFFKLAQRLSTTAL